MKHYRAILLFTFLTLFSTCKEKEEPKNLCQEFNKQLEGTYDITVTSYPLQTSQEGETKEVLLFPSYNCNGTIQFNNLFHFFGCTEYSFDGKHFKVNYEDNGDWQGADIQGKGSIIQGVFHFEGTVLHSGQEYLIILDGKKSTSFMRTSAC